MLQVTDEEGRRRFHGAFTGGFSAGYFNSVGTKEGWQPATFSSSRQERGRVQQRAEDFMDEDDDPLLGKRLETTAQYDTLQTGARRKQQQDAPRTAFEAQVLNSKQQSAISAYPAMNFLDDLVRPVNDSIGAKLLNRMGWKEGHGIGPRIRKKKIAETVQSQAADDTAAEDEVVYIPPRNTIDVSAFPKPKLDKYGAGFDPYVNAPEFSRYKQHQENELAEKHQQRQVVTFADAMKATSGSYETVTAFGLSALEDNDDLDVYGTTSMTEFDTAIGLARLTDGKGVKLIDSEARESLSRDDKKKQRRAPTFGSDGRPALPGFELAYVKEKPPKTVALRLEVPADFQPFHHFNGDNERHQADSAAVLYQKHNFSTGKHGQGSLMTAKQRAALLAEPQAPKAPESTTTNVNGVHTGSVFDLLGPEQKAKLFAAAAQVKANSTGKPKNDVVPPPRREPVERQPLVGGAAGTQFRANISASIAKRFVSASSSTEQQGDTEQSQVTQVPVATHKPSYRSESLWIPKSLLCKRFHVKCLVGTQSDCDRVSAEEEKRDLFDKELVPHLVEFAAERQSVNQERSGESGANNGASPAPGASLRPANRIAAKEKEEDELPPLLIVEKPAASLLRSIFEPSDESAVEEDGDDDDEDLDDYEDSDDDKEKAAPQADHAIGSLDARVSLGGQNSLTGTVPLPAARSSFGDDARTVIAGRRWNDTQQRAAVSLCGDRDRAAISSDESGSSSDSEQVATRASATMDPTALQQQVARDSSDTDAERKSKSKKDKKKKTSKSSKRHKKKHKKHHHRSSSRHADRDADDDERDEEGGRKHRKKRKESKKRSSSSKKMRSRSESRHRSEDKRGSRDSKQGRHH